MTGLDAFAHVHGEEEVADDAVAVDHAVALGAPPPAHAILLEQALAVELFAERSLLAFGEQHIGEGFDELVV